MLIKVVISIICVFVVLGLANRFRRRQIRPLSFFMWSALWIAIAIAVLWPNSTSYIAAVFGVGRGMDLVVFLSLLAIFYGMYRIYTKVNTVERKITQLVREQALRDIETDADSD